MKTFEMKTLMFVAAVACLPIACGTSSVTGPDASALSGSDSTVSALRVDPMPPTAPEAPSPETVPTPSPKPEVTPDPSVDVVPANRPQNGRRPGAPSAAPTQPTPDVTPLPAPGPTSDPGTPQDVPKCLAVSMSIVENPLFVGYPWLALEAVLLDVNSNKITDSSCDKMAWTVETTAPSGSDANRQAVIGYGPNPRFVTLSGFAGTYKIGAAAPNGTSSSRLVTLY